MIGKINNFFGDTSQQEKARAAAPGIVNAGLSAVHPNSQNDAGVAAQESMKNRNSGGFFSHTPVEPQEAGDPTMTQGEMEAEDGDPRMAQGEQPMREGTV